MRVCAGGGRSEATLRVCNSTNKGESISPTKEHPSRPFQKERTIEGGERIKGSRKKTEEKERKTEKGRRRYSSKNARYAGICMFLGRILHDVIILWFPFELVNPCLSRLIAVEKYSKSGRREMHPRYKSSLRVREIFPELYILKADTYI